MFLPWVRQAGYEAFWGYWRKRSLNESRRMFKVNLRWSMNLTFEEVKNFLKDWTGFYLFVVMLCLPPSWNFVFQPLLSYCVGRSHLLCNGHLGKAQGFHFRGCWLVLWTVYMRGAALLVFVIFKLFLLVGFLVMWKVNRLFLCCFWAKSRFKPLCGSGERGGKGKEK